MEIVNSYEAKTQLSKLIERALAGERIVIARAGRPLVELRPYRSVRPRVPGVWKGKARIARDFDAPVEELEQAVYKIVLPSPTRHPLIPNSTKAST
jgi:antitoxin (DNA-binding transcriptional repressor) of toxin-antitoxin stability system